MRRMSRKFPSNHERGASTVEFAASVVLVILMFLGMVQFGAYLWASSVVENAARHGDRVTTIAVSCKPDPDGLVITVEDNGVGVPLDLKEKIFEKDYGKHTGFGLFLAREILAITGITIHETGTHGKGARFEIIVPKGMYRFVE